MLLVLVVKDISLIAFVSLVACPAASCLVAVKIAAAKVDSRMEEKADSSLTCLTNVIRASLVIVFCDWSSILLCIRRLCYENERLQIVLPIVLFFL